MTRLGSAVGVAAGTITCLCLQYRKHNIRCLKISEKHSKCSRDCFRKRQRIGLEGLSADGKWEMWEFSLTVRAQLAVTSETTVCSGGCSEQNLLFDKQL